jgi:proprotein convertase subtilisin/kexin type 9
MYVLRRWINVLNLLLLAVFSGLAEPRRRPLVRAPRDAELTGEHLIVADKSLSSQEFHQLLTRISNGATVRSYVENVGKVITATLSPYAREMVRHLAGVDHIEEEDEARGDSLVRGWPIPWHLDRLDQEKGDDWPLDHSYQPIGTGEGVDIYVLDSGVRYEHSEFEFRAKYAGYDPYDEHAQKKGHDSIPMQGRDCHGHGTHVASLCGGKTFGTAKKVTLYSVRVLGCQNSAPWSVVLDGLEFVSRVIESRMRPAVVTMSLSGSYHQSVNDAVMELYKKNIPVVTVAGNGETDCCNRSPASSAHAITVAGTRLGDGLYRIGQGTNFGSCVDVFAPGEQITGASHVCWNCSKLLSGTSMAAPMVAGLVAIHLARTPRMTAKQVKERVINDSLLDMVNFQGMPRSYYALTPNRLVQIPGTEKSL